jgi:hypothetical protein
MKMDVKVIVEFAVAALIAIGILVGILIAIQADMCRTLYEVLNENISIRKIMMKQYIAIKLLIKKEFDLDVDEYSDIYEKIIDNSDDFYKNQKKGKNKNKE